MSDTYTRHAETIDFLAQPGMIPKRKSRADSEADVAALLADPLFVALDEAVSAYNPFKAAGLDQREVPHSNVLASLLSPLEGHGLGMRLLEQIFPAFAASDPGNIVVLREYSIETEQFSVTADDEEIAPKAGRRPDIIAYDVEAGVVGIIETKVRSGEGKDQRRDYRRWAREHFVDADRFHLIYLTPEGAFDFSPVPTLDRHALADSDEGEGFVWHGLSFAALSDVLGQLIDALAPADVPLDVVRQYRAFLGVHICPTTGCFASQARALWDRHPIALSTLIDARSALRQRAIRALKEDFARIGLAIGSVTQAGCDFRPMEGSDWSIPGHPATLRFALNMWNANPALMIKLDNGDPVLLKTVRKWFKHKPKRKARDNERERVVSHMLSLPHALTPYPITDRNRAQLEAHMRGVITAFARQHVTPGMAEIARLRVHPPAAGPA
jgi:hypothetical protein